jgi:hypothetical protein
MRFLRFFNWQFWATFVVVSLVIVGAYAGFSAAHDSVVKTRQIATLIDQGSAQSAEFKAERAQLLSEVTYLIADVNASQSYTKALADRQDAILAFMRAHGIQIPQQLITAIPAPRLIYVQTAKPSAGGGAGQSKPHQQPAPVKPGHSHKPHKH